MSEPRDFSRWLYSDDSPPIKPMIIRQTVKQDDPKFAKWLALFRRGAR